MLFPHSLLPHIVKKFLRTRFNNRWNMG